MRPSEPAATANPKRGPGSDATVDQLNSVRSSSASKRGFTKPAKERFDNSCRLTVPARNMVSTPLQIIAIRIVPWRGSRRIDFKLRGRSLPILPTSRTGDGDPFRRWNVEIVPSARSSPRKLGANSDAARRQQGFATAGRGCRMIGQKADPRPFVEAELWATDVRSPPLVCARRLHR